MLIAQGKLEEALFLLNRLRQAAEAGGQMGGVIENLSLQALALQAQGDLAGAMTALERALLLAEPEGFVRIFVDEGAPMAELLSVVSSQQSVVSNQQSAASQAYLDKLLAAFPKGMKDVGGRLKTGEESVMNHPSSLNLHPLVDPLSERELELLRLVATGHSNHEVAQELFLAVGTVKKHLNNIFGKLEAHNRTQAIARARELKLL